MPGKRLTRHFILLWALRWLPVGLVLPFLVLTPVARGLELGAVGAVFAIHSAVLIALEVPSGAPRPASDEDGSCSWAPA